MLKPSASSLRWEQISEPGGNLPFPPSQGAVVGCCPTYRSNWPVHLGSGRQSFGRVPGGADAYRAGLCAPWEWDLAPGSTRALCPCWFPDVFGHPLGMWMMGLSCHPRQLQACAGLPSATIGIWPRGCPPCRQHPCHLSSCSPALAHRGGFVQQPAACCCTNRNSFCSWTYIGS